MGINLSFNFIYDDLVEGFRTASGISMDQMLSGASSEGEILISISVFRYNLVGKAVEIDAEMKRQMRILSSLLCLGDLQRNKGKHGVVEKNEGGQNPIRDLKIVDFGVIV